ncbi:MAG: c-type cytochrome [Thermomicrobiales bacterium]
MIIAMTAAVMVVPRLGGAQGTPEASPIVPVDTAMIEQGEQIYTSVCIACHQAEGAGFEDAFPALAGNPFVTLEDPRPVVQTVLNGRAGMPSFRGYDDEEVAAITTYIRQAWGNEAGPVSPELVAEVREQFTAPSPPDGTPLPTGTPAP